MPNIKSAKKRLRTAEKNRVLNKTRRSRVTTTRRKFMEAAAGDDQAAGRQAFNAYCSALDKAVKRGVLLKNNADRRKSRAAKRLAALTAA